MSGHARELVHVEGLKELKDRLEEMLAEMDERACAEILVEVGEFLRDEARGNLPSHWLLTESIGFDVDAPNSGVVVGPRHGFETSIGDPAEYGIYHEFGIDGFRKTPKPGGGHYYQGPTPAKHYLRRALEENQAEIVQMVAYKIHEIIERRK